MDIFSRSRSLSFISIFSSVSSSSFDSEEGIWKQKNKVREMEFNSGPQPEDKLIQ